jgi:hypothetical protein
LGSQIFADFSPFGALDGFLSKLPRGQAFRATNSPQGVQIACRTALSCSRFDHLPESAIGITRRQSNGQLTGAIRFWLSDNRQNRQSCAAFSQIENSPGCDIRPFWLAGLTTFVT